VLHAGSTGADVEQILGQPTGAAELDAGEKHCPPV
jgi:hypothetical protein